MVFSSVAWVGEQAPLKSQWWYLKLVTPISSIVGLLILSLSTIVLNSKDWSEIVWLLEISHFKINLAISFIRKKPAGMHWLGYNDAVHIFVKQSENSNISAYNQF